MKAKPPEAPQPPEASQPPGAPQPPESPRPTPSHPPPPPPPGPAGHAPPAPAAPPPSDPLARRRSFWAAIAEALRGTEEDFTRGSLNRAVWLLAIPMVLEMAGESVFAVVDAFFVARLGAEALAAVGLTESLLEIIYAIAIGLAMATTAMVARRWGEGDERAAARAAVQAIWVGITFSAIFGGLGFFFAPDLLRLMGADEATVAEGTTYMRIMFGGMVAILLLFLNNASYRGAGDAAMAMRSVWFGNGINIVLDPCLIFGLGPFPELGLTGAAVATTTGRGLAVCYQLWNFSRGPRLRVVASDLRPDPGVIRRLLRISAGGVGQMFIGTASYVALIRILATFGTAVLAGYVIAIRVVIFVILPAWGVANAAATLVGQNLGAQKPERAERAVWVTGVWNMVCMAVVTVFLVSLPEPIIAVFTDDPVTLEIGSRALRVISYGYVFYAWGMVMLQAFNGAGDTATPTRINFFVFWLFQIPLAWVLSHSLGIGPDGVFWAIAIAYSLSAVIGVLLFRRGKWQEKEV